MKRLALLILVISAVNLSYSQDEKVRNRDREEINTLFGDHHVSNGGYGSFSIGYSEIDYKDAIVMGGRGAWIIGHWFALGFAGSGFLNDYSYNNYLGKNVNLSGGYGGLLMEPILLPKFPIHITLPVVFGVGGLAYTTSDAFNEYYEPNYWVEDATSFVVVEPGVELEFNIVRFFRISVGGYYRYTSDIQLYETPSDVLNGFSVAVNFKFGKF